MNYQFDLYCLTNKNVLPIKFYTIYLEILINNDLLDDNIF